MIPPVKPPKVLRRLVYAFIQRKRKETKTQKTLLTWLHNTCQLQGAGTKEPRLPASLSIVPFH